MRKIDFLISLFLFFFLPMALSLFYLHLTPVAHVFLVPVWAENWTENCLLSTPYSSRALSSASPSSSSFSFDFSFDSLALALAEDRGSDSSDPPSSVEGILITFLCDLSVDVSVDLGYGYY